jgi:hypothetical protein
VPNLLSDASKWTDEASASPPSYWNGTAYEFLSAYSAAESISATAAAGDVVSFTMAVNAASTHTTALAVTVNGTSVYTNDLQTLGDASFTSSALAAGDAVAIRFASQSGAGFEVYDLDVTLTPPVVACAELGRVTRAYVSGYQRDRVHASRLVRGEIRCLVANFNGAIPSARSIASVTWRCEQTYTVAMANARITGREVAVDITAQLQGCAWVKCVATLDNGEAYTQMFRLAVCAAPWFDGEQSPSAGPAVLTSP